MCENIWRENHFTIQYKWYDEKMSNEKKIIADKCVRINRKNMVQNTWGAALTTSTTYSISDGLLLCVWFSPE